jgi:ATP-dependent Clp protease protease subunit
VINLSKKAKEDKLQLTFSLEDYRDYCILEKRTIILTGEIDAYKAELTTERLFYLVSFNKNPITIILNSVGGDVYYGLLIFDTIRALVKEGIEINIEVRGLAASMGAIIVQAGSKRLGSKYSRFLIHEIAYMVEEKTSVKLSEAWEQAEELKKLNDMLKGILAERCKKTPKEIEKIWHKKDIWLSAQEALDFGLIDEVI